MIEKWYEVSFENAVDDLDNGYKIKVVYAGTVYDFGVYHGMMITKPVLALKMACRGQWYSDNNTKWGAK